MRSHIPRNVVRRLLAYDSTLPPVSSLRGRCLRRYPIQRPLVVARPAPRRTFFGVFQKPPREVKTPELEPGYGVLLQFRSTETDDARPPPREELVKGFRDFFGYKFRKKRPVNSTQAFCALRLFMHLSNLRSGPSELSSDDLRTAQEALLKPPKGSTADHLALCREIDRELNSRRLDNNPPKRTTNNADRRSAPAEQVWPRDFTRHITALCQYGASAEAMVLLPSSNIQSARWATALWLTVLEGLAKEAKEEKLLQGAEAAERAGLGYSPLFHQIMTSFYAKAANLDILMRWYHKPIDRQLTPTPETYLAILTSSDLAGDYKKFVDTEFQALCDRNPEKELWDVIFQWAVVSLGKGAPEIEHMVATMTRHNEGKSHKRPDISTINRLIQAAVHMKNPLLAERFIKIGTEMNITPDVTTYALQLEYRVAANDLGGASASFENLQHATNPEDEHVPVINKYIRALCLAKRPDMGGLLDVVSMAEQRGMAIEPETVVALCKVFLENDQQYEVIDTLSLHVLQYSLDEREVVRKAFVSYCLDSKKSSTARAWDAYSLLREFFPETGTDDRVRLMNGFFARKRADMACYIFGHMRAHTNPSIRPTSDIYVQCLEGLGRVPDMTSLKMVHNMLKMDTTIQMDTRMYNALMIAYTTCDDPSRALDFWKEIDTSADGPSYNSLAIVFRACEIMPYGDAAAKEIWAKIRRMEIDVPLYVFDAYCGAMAGQGHVEEVKSLISGVEASLGHAPEFMTVGIAYNALPDRSLRDNFETWAAEEYPDLWKKANERGRSARVDSLPRLKIYRELKA